MEVSRDTVALTADANIRRRDLKRSGVYTIGGSFFPCRAMIVFDYRLYNLIGFGRDISMCSDVGRVSGLAPPLTYFKATVVWTDDLGPQGKQLFE